MRFSKAFFGIAAVLACGAFSNALATPPVGPSFAELGHLVPGFGETARSRFAVGDVDGDGLQDVVFVARAGDEVLFVLGKQNGALRLKQSSLLPDTNVVRVLRAPAGDGIYTLSDDGMLRHYTGWPLREQGHVTVTAGANAAAIGDVNGDGLPEVVICNTSDILSVHSLATGNLLWSLPATGGSDLLLMQLDADPALEIVVANIPGKVIDGATQALDWQYKDGFGTYLASGHFGTSSENRFVAARDWDSFAVFRGAPFSPLWDYTTFDIDAIAGADLDGDGVDEVLQGDGQWGDVLVIDSSTHVLRTTIPNPGYAVKAIAAADLDGNGAKEVAFATNSAGLDSRTLFVSNAQTGNLDWSFDSQYGVFTVTAVGDLNGDGHAEQIVGTSNSSTVAGIRILDAASGDELWRAAVPSNANDALYMSPARILIAQMDNDPQKEIVLAGSSYSDGRIVILDGITRQVQRQIGAYASGPLRNRTVVDAALMNYDGDGILDIVVATSAANTGSSGARLHVFSGATGDLLWESVGMGSGFAGMRGVLVGNFDADPQPELVAVLPTGLRAYDSQTQLLDWSLPVSADGALLLPFGANSAELAVFDSSGSVSFYNATTRALLRSMTLPSSGMTALASPDGDAGLLLAAVDGKLYLVDGIARTVLATSDYLGSRLGEGNQLSIWPLGPHSWHVGSGSAVGIFRHRLDLGDAIFANGFE